jgi:enediyne biosynthesis protein E4
MSNETNNMFYSGKSFFSLLCLIILICSCRQEKLFTSLPSSETNIYFSNKLEERPRLNILYYLYFYNGGGVSVGDVNNDGLPDIYFTANSRGNNKLYLNKGNFKFEDITASAGVAGTADWCSGVTMADVNSDGLLDIYVSTVSNAYGLKGHNLLYINNGKKDGGVTFTESAAEYGLNFSGLSTQAAFFDFDHDGDLDCYLLNHSHHPHANVVDTANRRKVDSLSGDHFYRNELNAGQKKFTDISAQAGIYQSSLGYGLGLAVADFNNDGWEDVYVGNDFHENDYYYLNNGNGTFRESGASHFNHYSRFSMGNDAADYNNDGHLDLITVDMLPPDEKVLKTYGSDENPDIYKVKLQLNGYQHQYSRNVLQRNNGNGGSFSEVGLLSGVSATDWSWSPLFSDFDNDGNKDLFIASGIVKRPVDLDYVRFVSDLQMRKGLNKTDKYDSEALEKMPDGAIHPFVFKGDGQINFEDKSEAWGTADLNGYHTGAAYADLDNDGALDLVVNCINAPAVILKNNAPKKSFLSLSFRGDTLNTAGIGAKAYLFANGKLQYQHLMLTRGFQSSSDARLHFGLDTVKKLDSMVVVWPDQTYQVLKNVQSNQHMTIQKQDASGQFNYSTYVQQQPPLLEAVENTTINWQHQENDFVDYNVQYLIPHAQSTRGPKIAVGDVNGDGLDDLYLCGAHGQPGSLMVQQTTGSFLPLDKAVFEADAACEDVDASFFDANGDGRLDLYVVSGGNQVVGKDSALLDRMYINDGNGHFSKTTGALPPIYTNKSCVTVTDVDGDGDNDIFVGTLADATAYGIPQTSHLLLNDGRGQFAVAGENVIALSNIGMVTSAAFADINKDGWQDLLVAGEWMPITLFTNNKGRFAKSVVPASTGWWQTIYVDDVNADGNIDLLGGNWGWNNKFRSGKNGPVRLYVKDFDKNGKVDQLLSYTVNGKEYPFLAKDEMERSLPALKKHYLLYADYAGVEMKDVFYGYAEQVEPLVAERLGSAVLYGDGKGAFEIHDLPAELQLTPVFSFRKLKHHAGAENLYAIAGNFFDVIPYEGRYDAQAVAVFSAKDKNIRYIHQSNLAAIPGQVRDLKWLRSAKNVDLLAVVSNNQPLQFYRRRE